jgi:hypothetical protein
LPLGIRSFSLRSSNCKEVVDQETGRSYLEMLVERYERLGRLDLWLYEDDMSSCLTPRFFYQLVWNRCCGALSSSSSSSSANHGESNTIPSALWPVLLERVTDEFVTRGDGSTTISDIPDLYGELGKVDVNCPRGTQASILYNLLRRDASWMTPR